MKRLLILFCLQCCFSLLHAQPVKIVLWHSLAGNLGTELGQLVGEFNQSQQDYYVKTVYKGEYSETLTSFAAAFRAKQPPALVQIFEVGTATMLHPKGIIKPVYEVLQEQGLSVSTESFLPAVRAFYSEGNKLLAMPFNTSIPVLYYNADALAKLGYDRDSFPQTWDEMEVLAAKLQQAGFSCVYTSAYPAWIQIESFSAIHGLSMIAADQSHITYNNKAIIKHLERLKRWQDKHYFEYGGRASDATVLFTSGRCPLYSQSSGSYNSLAELVPFRLAVAALPLDQQVSANRHNNIAGGAAFWVVAGHSAEVYQGVAAFFSFLAKPEVQQQWHQHTGYLPLGLTGSYATLALGPNPILALAAIDLGKQSDQDAPLHLGPQNQIRIINDEALEVIFAGIKTPEQALNEAAKRANFALLRFARNSHPYDSKAAS